MIAIIDGALGIFVGKVFGYLSNWIRPIVAITFMGQVRQQFNNVLFTMKELAIFVASLFIYVLIFALLCAFYFRESFQGVMYMSSIHETFFELFILLTTANFPDVMLPAYNVSWQYTLIFIIYLSVGLYFFLNIILASVFNVFKGRIEKDAKENHDSRIERINDAINRYSVHDKETMDYYQAKEFFAFVFSWNF